MELKLHMIRFHKKFTDSSYNQVSTKWLGPSQPDAGETMQIGRDNHSGITTSRSRNIVLLRRLIIVAVVEIVVVVAVVVVVVV